jgi:hypothetical protein
MFKIALNPRAAYPSDNRSAAIGPADANAAITPHRQAARHRRTLTGPSPATPPRSAPCPASTSNYLAASSRTASRFTCSAGVSPPPAHTA